MLVHDPDNKEYQVPLEGEYVAIAKYTLSETVMTIHSTRVPDEVQGKGYGKVMMEAILPRSKNRVTPSFRPAVTLRITSTVIHNGSICWRCKLTCLYR